VVDDVSLTWTRADVDVLAWLLTWSDDVIRMTSDDISRRFPARGMRVTSLPARGGEARNLGSAWGRV